MADQALQFKNLGNTAFKEQKFKEAAELFGKAIECNPSDHVLYSNRSGAYASLNDYENALEDANKCVELKPDWSKGYVRKGLAEFYLKKYDDAIQTYEAGLAIEPTNAQLIEGKQRAETEKVTGGKSVPGMDQAQLAGVIAKLKANPKTAAYLNDPNFLQQVQMFLGNPNLMKQNPQMMLQLIQQDPRLMECFMVLQGIDPDAMGGSKGGNQNQKVPEEEEIIVDDQPPKQETKMPEPKKQETKKPEPKKQDLDEATMIKNEGNTLYKQKKFDEALEKYDKAIELKPTELLFYNNKAACYVEKKDLDKAYECCQQALKIREEHAIYDFQKTAKIYARLGSICEKQGDYKSSVEWFDKSLLEDTNANIKLDYKRVEKLYKAQQEQQYLNPELAEEANEKARQFFQNGQFKEAYENYTDAIKRNPQLPKYFCNRGICFIKLMEWVKAVEDFDKCIQLDSKYLKAYLKKADCQTFMKEYHKAKTTLEVAAKIDPANQEIKQKLQQLSMKMYTSGGNKEEQQQRAQQAMKDPEIQKILMTPEIQNALKAMQSSQSEAMKVMSDPNLAPKIQILIEAGVLQLG